MIELLSAAPVTAQLEQDGIVILSNFLGGETLKAMQDAFELRLRHQRWNDVDGYEKTERFRHMVQDVLMLEQGFVDVALHPTVKETLRQYIGTTFELVEAKGWKSLPTKKDFHGWHGDAWYDQTKVSYIPREVKLAVYLTDVNTGFFEYVKGSHRKEAPHQYKTRDVEKTVSASQIVQARGPAGTAFLFDTTGIHRQSYPILESRNAIFYNYHDPNVPLQKEDVDYYRYHPLILNAAFLGGLSEEDRRILGFGNKTNYIPGFTRALRHKRLQTWQESLYNIKLVADEWSFRIKARLARTMR